MNRKVISVNLNNLDENKGENACEVYGVVMIRILKYGGRWKYNEYNNIIKNH